MTTNAILATESLKTMPALNPNSAARSRLTRLTRHGGMPLSRAMPLTTASLCLPSRPPACIAVRRARRGGRAGRMSSSSSPPSRPSKAGYRACLRCRPKSISGNAQSDDVKAICRFIEQHLDEPLTLSRLGKEFHQSPFHLQRRFKAVLGITPREYADSCRMRLLKRNLQSGDSVTRAMYDAGYGSSSRLYEKTASQLGMTPDKYRRGAIAAAIRYTCADSPLGRMLIAATDRGICAIQFARTDGELIEGLKREFPFAMRKSDDGGLRSWVSALLKHMRGKDLDSSLPLDIRATAFQRRVWDVPAVDSIRQRRNPTARSPRASVSRPPCAPWPALALPIR